MGSQKGAVILPPQKSVFLPSEGTLSQKQQALLAAVTLARAPGEGGIADRLSGLHDVIRVRRWWTV